MAQQVLVKRESAGVEVFDFHPTPQMQLYAMMLFCDRTLSKRTPEAVCEAAGIPTSAYRRFLDYEPHFSEWLEDRRLILGGRSRKAVLEAVGMEQALKGEFNFWKAMAIKEGVIDPDRLDVGAAIPANLGAFKEMTPDELKTLENTVLADLRGEGVPGEIALVEGPSGWEPEGNPGGAPEVSGPVVLADELGSDGERALSELESF